MVILVQYRKSPQKKWLKLFQNDYFPKTKGFLKYIFLGLFLDPKAILSVGV